MEASQTGVEVFVVADQTVKAGGSCEASSKSSSGAVAIGTRLAMGCLATSSLFAVGGSSEGGVFRCSPDPRRLVPRPARHLPNLLGRS